jgi:phosphinothricin acetyltransferase
MEIRAATLEDAPAIEAIYAHYVLTSTCTFQEEPGSLAERRAWLADRGPRHPVTVAVDGEEVVGWGALSPWNRRSGYRHTVENSVYVRHDRQRRGIGDALLGDLVRRARRADLRVIVAGVSADQPGSLALHRAHGFEPVGTLRGVGLKFGRWLDVTWLQLVLTSR